MVFPAGHYLIVFGGSLPGGESWQMSLRQIGGSFNTDQAADQAECDAVAAAIQAWWTSNGAFFPGCTLAFVKRNHVGIDGRYANGYTCLTEFDPPLTGTGTIRLPNQCAVAVTLSTGISRGLASKGRVFVPTLGVTIGADGRMSEATRNTINTLVKALLDGINAVNPGGAQVAVVSGTREGASRRVVAVETGRVVDTIRSRRSSLLEERVPVPVADPPA